MVSRDEKSWEERNNDDGHRELRRGALEEVQPTTNGALGP
jgi:hypothetical protein